MSYPGPNAGKQHGVVLVTSLLLLVVVTIIALSMFRSFGIQEKIAGNMREKQRALQAAVSAQQYAEWWLSNNATAVPVTCSALLNANLNQGQICANKLSTVVPDVTTVPWKIGGTGAQVGVSYVPPPSAGVPTMTFATSASVSAGNNPTYYGNPNFYISDLGPSADPNIPGEIYQVDAYAYGGASSTAAVVESTYAVYTSSSCRSCP